MAVPRPRAGSVALITGASSGVGAELAKLLAARGHDIVITARRKDRLDRLAAQLTERHGVAAFPIACDVADPASRAALINQVAALGLAVDVFVNNAGFGTSGSFCTDDPARSQLMVRTNFESAVGLAAAWVPGMVDRGCGAVLFVASLLAVQPLPGAVTYSATKAALSSFAAGLRCEVAAYGVTVSVICPGPIRTEFFDANGIDEQSAAPGFMFVSPEQVARVGVAALERNRRMVVPNRALGAAAVAARFMPRALSEALIKRAFPA